MKTLTELKEKFYHQIPLWYSEDFHAEVIDLLKNKSKLHACKHIKDKADSWKHYLELSFIREICDFIISIPEQVNSIENLFQSLTDAELKQAVKEIYEDNKLGYIRSEGFVRKLAEKSNTISNTSVSTMLFLSEISILRQAAFRWLLENKIE